MQMVYQTFSSRPAALYQMSLSDSLERDCREISSERVTCVWGACVSTAKYCRVPVKDDRLSDCTWLKYSSSGILFEIVRQEALTDHSKKPTCGCVSFLGGM
jgi:hypothetical protein